MQTCVSGLRTVLLTCCEAFATDSAEQDPCVCLGHWDRADCGPA